MTLEEKLEQDKKLREELIEACRPLLLFLKRRYRRTGGSVHSVKVVGYTVTPRIELTQQLGNDQIIAIDIDD
jgi:hypothetical protein